jgi:GNAT superfamily N-acetyltransferase
VGTSWRMSDEITIACVLAENAPWPLLALADPSEERVRRCVQDGRVFVGEEKGKAVAVAVVRRNGETLELMNIAVAEDRRGRGFGGKMLAYVLEFARGNGVRRVEVGTGNSSVGPLMFYQRNGFRITGVETDFFKNDEPPIFEDGVRCLDMIRLSREIGGM